MNNILQHEQIEEKINRLAHEIIENTFEEQRIYLGGICGNGSVLAHLLSSIIKKYSDQEIIVFELELDKEHPWDFPITLSIPQSDLKNGFIILVDDVLNSGKTMQYSLVKLLEEPTKSIKTVALVDRTHRRYPIKADFVGLSLSTTLKERVEIDLTPGNYHAYLV
jgi:pyrimidine operon attenuation protein/uracil phosphoribosyltransferase